MGQDPVINFLESYFDIPANMIEVLIGDLQKMEMDEINQIDTKLFKLNSETASHKHSTMVLKNRCPKGKTKMCRIYFILIISRTFPDKEAHNHIIRDHIMKLKIKKTALMESYQGDMLCHLKQQNSIKGTEWKQIINNIIKQHRKIDDSAYRTGLNIKSLSGPKKIILQMDL
jgi:hypothetical protein